MYFWIIKCVMQNLYMNSSSVLPVECATHIPIVVDNISLLLENYLICHFTIPYLSVVESVYKLKYCYTSVRSIS